MSHSIRLSPDRASLVLTLPSGREVGLLPDADGMEQLMALLRSTPRQGPAPVAAPIPGTIRRAMADYDKLAPGHGRVPRRFAANGKRLTRVLSLEELD